MKESEEENDKTRCKVIEDRKMQIEAGIVRIMKMRKKLNHTDLMSELTEQLNFPIRQVDFKKRLEDLLDQEYIKRNDEDKNVYEYLA